MNDREGNAAIARAESGQGTDGSVVRFYQLGLDHMRAGRFLEAQRSCEQALALDPDHADTLHLVGLLCVHTKQLDHAVEWLFRAIRREPKPLYLTTLGTAFLQQGRGADALQAFERAIEIEPDNAQLRCNLGLALAELRRNDEAILSFQHALKLDPGLWNAASKAAILLRQAARFEEALLYFNLCDELRPNNIQTLAARSETLQGLRRYEEAFGDVERVHLLDPTNADAPNQMGNNLAALGRYEEALSWYDRAITLRDGHALRNKAIMLGQIGRFDEALAAYRQAVAEYPAEAGLEWNLALLQLLIGDFEAGWAGREAARWRIPELVEVCPMLSRPIWQGAEPIDGKTILVRPDEGLGDVIQFVRYVPMLAERGAHVILIVQDELYPLLSRFPGVAQCLPRSATTAPPYDVHCPLTSLPLAFGTRLDTIPAEACYLPAPPADRVEAWQERLGSHDRLRVGLVWSGNPRHKNDRLRSMPFRTMSRILDSEATFVSLQKDPRLEDRAALLERTDVIDLTLHLSDFVETAAFVSCLDLVISVDTSVAHLSAALGRPTWILLPNVPDYRWLLDREDSPWYPTVRLFRQDERRDYAHVIERVRAELNVLITERNSAAK